MPPTMQPHKLQPDAEGFAVLAERVGNMMDAINGLREEFRDSIDQMVKHKDELQSQKWQIAQLQRDLEASEKRLREEIERSSIKKIWGNFTGIVSGVLSVIALVAVLTGWKPGP